MVNYTTNYLGIQLKNPVIVSSSGLTENVAKIEKLALSGAGAVVLKSLFEEQIRMEAGSILHGSDYPEAQDYIEAYVKSNALETYLKLISDTKSKVDIPVIASINCISSSEWVSFAKNMQDAGADALELNVFIMPSGPIETGSKYEEIYYSILDAIRKVITIPVAVKIGQNFSSIPYFIDRLNAFGAKGVVLFNRFYAPDINLDTFEFGSSEILSNPSDIRQSLRWVGIISSLVPRIDVCASTGIHDANAVIKQILAGAQAVQVCSVLYKNGPDYLKVILSDIDKWMKKNNFSDIKEIRGRMSYKNIPDPAVFERAQFMKYFSKYT